MSFQVSVQKNPEASEGNIFRIDEGKSAYGLSELAGKAFEGGQATIGGQTFDLNASTPNADEFAAGTPVALSLPTVPAGASLIRKILA